MGLGGPWADKTERKCDSRVCTVTSCSTVAILNTEYFVLHTVVPGTVLGLGGSWAQPSRNTWVHFVPSRLSWIPGTVSASAVRHQSYNSNYSLDSFSRLSFHVSGVTMSRRYCDVDTTGTVKGKADRGIGNGLSKFFSTMLIWLLRFKSCQPAIQFTSPELLE